MWRIKPLILGLNDRDSRKHLIGDSIFPFWCFLCDTTHWGCISLDQHQHQQQQQQQQQRQQQQQVAWLCAKFPDHGENKREIFFQLENLRQRQLRQTVFSLHFLVCSDGLEGSNQYALNSHYRRKPSGLKSFPYLPNHPQEVINK